MNPYNSTANNYEPRETSTPIEENEQERTTRSEIADQDAQERMDDEELEEITKR
jgi:hypothetical protein